METTREVPHEIVEEKSAAADAGSAERVPVSLDDYLANYAAQHYEYVEGVLVEMSPASLIHNNLIYYVFALLNAYFELTQSGQVVGQPFVMRLPAFPERRREPDLMVILNGNTGTLTPTAMDGAPDIVIEIVSDESVTRDYGEKFEEYEKGGVPEYWLIDPIRQDAVFFRRGEKVYARHSADADGHYESPALPGLRVHVPTLWADKLPGPAATARAVAAMLNR